MGQRNNKRVLLVATALLNLFISTWVAIVWWQGALCAALVAAALFIAARPDPIQMVPLSRLTEEQIARSQALQTLSGFRQFFVSVLPRWAKNLTLVREQTRDAVENLVQRFSSLSQMIADSQADQRDEGIVMAAIGEAERGLNEIIATLDRTQALRQTLVDQISGTARLSGDLGAMAERVAAIASQTNLLALNAAIEAARAGQAGRGFAVVADEVRKLSNESGATGVQIRETIKSVSQTIAATIAMAADCTEKEHRLVQRSRETAAHIVSRFTATANTLEDSLAALRQKQLAIDSDIQEVLVNLQFQDRVQQIVDHVLDDVARAEAAAADETSPDSETWLARLSSTYTTLEQQAVHRDLRATVAAKSEITFF